MLTNGLLKVPRPRPIDIRQAHEQVFSVKPFVPYHFSKPYTCGRVRALLIGINYFGSEGELGGCINDVVTMLKTLERIQFPITECCILVDDPGFQGSMGYPTRENITKYMAWLTHDARPGDVLFFHYSGHGGQCEAEDDSFENYDQCLIPVDFDTAGSILDNDLFYLLVSPLPSGCRMTCIFDCCHSASMLDLPFSFVATRDMSSGRQGYTMKCVRNNNFSHGDVVMFSGCTDSGTSSDVHNPGSDAGGAATQAFTWALINTTNLNFMNILCKTRDLLKSKGFKQIPQLTSSKPIDLYKPFSLFGSIEVNQRQMSLIPQHLPPPHLYPPPQQQYIPSQQYPPPQAECVPPQHCLAQRQHYIPPQQYPSPQPQYVPPQQYLPSQPQYVPPQQYLPSQPQCVPPQQYLPPQQFQSIQGSSSHPQGQSAANQAPDSKKPKPKRSQYPFEFYSKK
ncbi:unnamed protein product [Phytomonas sp. Hart1]|nr:unnamed protein product [Phytomonas sp. Hart1]|eukprot:CCW69383.1 unnamed protein product [Phytomonas sp. isolate Hart1]